MADSDLTRPIERVPTYGPKGNARRIIVEVPDDLKQEFMVACAERGERVCDVLRDYIARTVVIRRRKRGDNHY